MGVARAPAVPGVTVFCPPVPTCVVGGGGSGDAVMGTAVNGAEESAVESPLPEPVMACLREDETPQNNDRQ